MSEEVKETKSVPNLTKLLHKIAEVKKEMKDLYKSLPENEKHLRKVWRPLEKELMLLFFDFEGSFFFEEKVARENKRLENEKQQVRAKLKNNINNAIKAQEKLT